ncbi:uncharacterized protein BT62DRAFT_1014465 [Guyanagaster necrorhizus]|uniref:Uncharacterized protein n=1 Tax=Guyanagaster necrorhizus TaxID=856835 RepID=A0A9P7VEF1_9AGAR|nr:uncharacterized protein BT62DRAFT_1014465 [Guyanagaster necrorhizus MCA 3950]KAG7439047.1 hypothetical protein BT62DRAFT_1014465 [Guyanagaster necrorhizus MCA 3950]
MCAAARVAVTNSVASMIPPARITTARRNTMSEHPTGDDPPRWSGTYLRYSPPTKLRQCIWPVGQVCGRHYILSMSSSDVVELLPWYRYRAGVSCGLPISAFASSAQLLPGWKSYNGAFRLRTGKAAEPVYALRPHSALVCVSFRAFPNNSKVSPSTQVTSYVFTIYVTIPIPGSPLLQQRRCRHNVRLL